MPEDARLFVELVLVAAPARDLDDDVDAAREVGMMGRGHDGTIRHRTGPHQ